MPHRVLILKDVLSAKTGGTKLTLDVAKAFQSIGEDVKIVFFHTDGTEEMIRREYSGINIEIFEQGTHFTLSQMLQAPVINLFLRDAFKQEDAINLFGQIGYARMVNRLAEKYDIIISMSMWTGIVPMLIRPAYRGHTLLYFHEPPTFGGLPLPVRMLLKTYVRMLLKAITLNVSTTEIMRTHFVEAMGMDCAVVKDSFSIKPVTREKEEFVLADTRWTFVRNPYFIIDIARLAPGIRFVMCGRFGSEELREKFMSALGESGLAGMITVRDENTEEELDYYYSRAKCYIRWSSQNINEAGPSYGLIQAVSNGCVPIVSDNLGSSVDVAENLGEDFVVRNNASEFAGEIRKLFGDSGYFSDSLGKVIKWRDSYTGKEYARLLLSLTGTGE